MIHHLSPTLASESTLSSATFHQQQYLNPSLHYAYPTRPAPSVPRLIRRHQISRPLRRQPNPARRTARRAWQKSTPLLYRYPRLQPCHTKGRSDSKPATEVRTLDEEGLKQGRLTFTTEGPLSPSKLRAILPKLLKKVPTSICLSNMA